MSAELQPKVSKTTLRIIDTVGIASCLAGVYGIIEGIRYQQTSDFQEYRSRVGSLNIYEESLVKDGVLARNNQTFGNLYDIRIPDDPRASEWGRLRHEMDLEEEARKSNFKNSPIDQLKQTALVGVLFGPLLLWGRSRLRH